MLFALDTVRLASLIYITLRMTCLRCDPKGTLCSAIEAHNEF